MRRNRAVPVTMPGEGFLRLARTRVRLPAGVRTLRVRAGLSAACRERPAYRPNDDLGWFLRATRDATRATDPGGCRRNFGGAAGT